MKMLTFQNNLVSEVYLMGLVLLSLQDILVNYNSVDESDILNIRKYLMAMNNII